MVFEIGTEVIRLCGGRYTLTKVDQTGIGTVHCPAPDSPDGFWYDAVDGVLVSGKTGKPIIRHSIKYDGAGSILEVTEERLVLVRLEEKRTRLWRQMFFLRRNGTEEQLDQIINHINLIMPEGK